MRGKLSLVPLLLSSALLFGCKVGGPKPKSHQEMQAAITEAFNDTGLVTAKTPLKIAEKCELMRKQWDKTFAYRGELSYFESSLAYRRMAANQPLLCEWVRWDWINADVTPYALELRANFIGLLGNEQAKHYHHQTLSGLTVNGSVCSKKKGEKGQQEGKQKTSSAQSNSTSMYVTNVEPPIGWFPGPRGWHKDPRNVEKDKSPLPKWQEDLCKQWITHPIDVTKQFKSGKLKIDPDKHFRSVTLEELPEPVTDQKTGKVNKDETLRNQTAWLRRVVQKVGGRPDAELDTFVAILEKNYEWRIVYASLWVHPKMGQAVVELNIPTWNMIHEWPFGIGSWHTLLLIDKGKFRAVAVPNDFVHSGYESGHEIQTGKVIAVSDMDDDGNPEVWFKGKSGFDDEDDKRGVKYAIESILMGEIRGDLLTYYHYSPK